MSLSPAARSPSSSMAASGMAAPSTPHGRSGTRTSGGRRSRPIVSVTRIRTHGSKPTAGRRCDSGRTSRRSRLPRRAPVWLPRRTRSTAHRHPTRKSRTDREDDHHMGTQNERQPQTYRARPEPGQLVEVRCRQWVVADVDAAGLETGVPQHCVTLSSIDEDGLGEELEVVWEIEPGAPVIEGAGLPSVTAQDDSGMLAAFVDAVRWGAATNADRGFLQAPFRSGVSIEDFQLDPLVRAIDMARVNLLIADDVGLGKTIEAGLVIQELLLRHRARTVLIVCPASLQEKWRVEMLEKFGLDFRVVDTDYIKQLRRERGTHANPWTSHPRLITSMDWAKGGEGLRAMRDVIPAHVGHPRKFDLLVVDEAHNVAPAAGAHYALESQRTRFVRAIGPHFQHRLFLTATPHNGYTESFTALLELLDDQRF